MQTEAELKILNSKIADSLPAYAVPGSAGLDLHAYLDEAVVLQPGDVYLVPTGLAVHLANPVYAAVLPPRSGLGYEHGIVLGNLVGLIDLDYQGESKISLWNRGKGAFTTEPMERITQIAVVSVVQAAFRVVDEFAASERGEDGLGDTGKA